MAAIRFFVGVAILFLISISRVKATCVLNSDFGFTLDCAFKKSGLFRVRNLGGIKAHVGLGFSVGDELGFGQSLTNLDTSKRRSVAARNGAPGGGNNLMQVKQLQKENNERPKKNRLTVRIPSTSTTPAPVVKITPTISQVPAVDDNAIQTGRASSIRQLTLTNPPPMVIPPFKPIPPAQDMIAPTPTSQSQIAYNQYAIPSKATSVTQNQKSQNLNRMGQVPKSNFVNVSAAPMRVLNVGQTVRGQSGYSNTAEQGLRTVPAPVIVGTGPQQYPSFHAMPASISRITTGTSMRVDDSPIGSVSIVSPQSSKNTVQIPIAPNMMSRYPTAASYAQNTISLRRDQGPASAFPAQYQSNNYAQLQNQFSYNQLQEGQAQMISPKIDNMVAYNTVGNQNGASEYPSQGTLQEKILAISKATNLSVEAIEAAIKLRQQQLISQMMNTPPSTTSTTSTTPRPPPPPSSPAKRYTAKYAEPAQKVMNAPKEYYPVGYDKNFDDNFVSKVELPETSFYCGDQKHFPGLYGDEDLGCMVFHVCALTDEGLIMKSFLCPESTLFDQTILKCNWWFYVDCKSSKRLYDSNIPISKSYQLMKALTFFSSYKKDVQGEDPTNNLAKSSAITENKEGVRNAVKILQTQSHMELPKVEIIESKSNRSTDTPQASRNSKLFTPVNVVEINSLSSNVNEGDNTAAEKVEKIVRKHRQHPTSRSRESNHSPVDRVATKSPVVKNTEYKNLTRSEVNTQKSVVQSTSVRKSIRKKNNVSQKSGEIISTSSTSTSTESSEDIKHRSERASEESKDGEIPINKMRRRTLPNKKINIQEVTGNPNSHVIKPNRDAVDVTIAKMDEAIIGQKKQDST